jgi:hypothetical protein
MVSDDGEYEWFRTVRAEHLRALLTELGGNEEDDALDLLAERYCGQASYDLERRLHESRLPIELLVD